MLRAEIFIEFHPQTIIEGEIQQLGPDHPTTELWEVVNGSKAARTSDEQITIFDSVGFAIEDFVALRYLDDAVGGTPYCTRVELITSTEDPKNLFSQVTELGFVPEMDGDTVTSLPKAAVESAAQFVLEAR